MHYLTNYYKNHCEQLQERVNFLKSLLIEKNIYFFVEDAGIEDWTLEDIDKWIDSNVDTVPDKSGNKTPITPEVREEWRNVFRKRIEKEKAARGPQSSSREEEMRRENARRHAEAAQAEQDRARRQAEADERWRQRANQASAEEAARRSGAGAQASSGPQTGAGERPGSGQDPFEEFVERVRQGYRQAYQAGAESAQRRQAEADAAYKKWEQEQHARDAAADERIRAEEEAGKFSNRAKKAASGAWEAVKPAIYQEMDAPTFAAMGRYAQQMFQKPGETAKAAASGLGSVAAQTVKHPVKTTGKVAGTVGIPLLAGIAAETAADKAMGWLGFERNKPENERNFATQIFSERPSARSMASYSAAFAATDATAQALANARALMNTSIASKPGLSTGVGRQALRGAFAGPLAQLTGYVAYKGGEALGKALGLHDDMDEKQAVALGQHAPGTQRLGNYPTVAQLQAQSRKEAEEALKQAEQRGLDAASTKNLNDILGMTISDIYKKSTSLEQRREAAKRRAEEEEEEEEPENRETEQEMISPY